MKIYIETGDFGAYVLSNDEDNRTILIQSDWDYPGVASTFGWIPCGQCRESDGTVACAHNTVSEMIASAAEYLDDGPGPVEDPGYFGQE
jgi:hypothetical protein